MTRNFCDLCDAPAVNLVVERERCRIRHRAFNTKEATKYGIRNISLPFPQPEITNWDDSHVNEPAHLCAACFNKLLEELKLKV